VAVVNKQWLILAALLAVALAIAGSQRTSPSVSIYLVQLRTNNLNEVNGRPTIHSYVVADCLLTNGSARPIRYMGMSGTPAILQASRVLQRWTTNGPITECSLGMRENTLASFQTTNFSFLFLPAIVLPNERIEEISVSLPYKRVRKFNSYLPRWFNFFFPEESHQVVTMNVVI
jgi:hypothetical protein